MKNVWLLVFLIAVQGCGSNELDQWASEPWLRKTSL